MPIKDSLNYVFKHISMYISMYFRLFKKWISWVLQWLGVAGWVLTVLIIIVNSIFNLQLSTYLRNIPFIEQFINIELIEEFEAIQEDDVFYQELKVNMDQILANTWDIAGITVREDAVNQKTFKIKLKDGSEEMVIVTNNDENYEIKKQVSLDDIKDKSITVYHRTGSKRILVPVKQKGIAYEKVYIRISTWTVARWSIWWTTAWTTKRDTEIKEKVEKEIEETAEYQQGYEKWKEEWYRIWRDIEYKKWYKEWHEKGYDEWQKDGYNAGFTKIFREAYGYAPSRIY